MKVTLFRKPRVAVTFSCLLAFAGCATVSPSKVVENPYVTDGVSEDVATVTFIRVLSFTLGGVAIPVYLNGKLALKMRTETYATLSILPGRYDISTGKDRMDLPGVDEAKAYHGDLVFLPGETYFILLYPEQYGAYTDQTGIAWPTNWIKFKILDRDKANRRMSCYGYSSLNTDTAPSDTPSLLASETLEKLPLPMMRTGTFSSGGPEVEKITMRLSTFAPPDGDSFADYLKNALQKKLEWAGFWDPSSSMTISGVLLDNYLYTMGMVIGKADLAAEFTVTVDDQEVYRDVQCIHHEWDSAIFYKAAESAAHENYVLAVEKLLMQLLTDPEFPRAAD